MAEERQRVEWARTSSVMALIANVNRDPKKTKEFAADDFNPYSDKRDTGQGSSASGRSGSPVPMVDIRALKTVFIDRRMPRIIE